MKATILICLILAVLCPSILSHDNESIPYETHRPKPIPHSRLKCFGCTVLATILKTAYFTSQSQECLAAVVAKICKLLNIENSRVCDSAITQYQDEVLYVVGELLLNPRQFCGFILENCSEAYNPLTNNWTVPLPPKRKVKGAPKATIPNSPTLRVLQLSDLHYDPKYAVGSEVDCTYPLCCRNRGHENGPVIKPAGKWGSVGRCDAPYALIENLFQHLRDNQTFDYIIWTGDIPPHDVWNQTREEQLEAYEFLVNMLIKYFPEKMVLAAVGNHESAPADSFPPHFATLPRKYSISWLYDALADHWTRWVPVQSRAGIRNKASYMMQLFPGLRVIAINTNYGLATNFWLYLNDTDPDNDLAWLVQQLYEAEKAGDKVHIIGHTASGDIMGLPQWSKNYYNIINRFKDTVVAQFFGHTHSDQYAVFYESADYRKPATSISYISPSVTTFDAYMPAYRIYTIDGNHTRSTWKVLDYETYYANLTEANLSGKLEWKLEYRAKETYGMKDLSPDSWNLLINRLLKNETLARTFVEHYYRRNDVQCDQNCTLDILCQLRTSRSHDFSFCTDFPEHFRKRKLVQREHSNERPKLRWPIPFVPKECLPTKLSARQTRLLLNRTTLKLNPNCETIQNECHNTECGEICENLISAHSRLGQPGMINQCREAVCHVSSDCCCVH